ncbi:hypothetical protein FHS76_003474 [Ochrobactrum daejeonense]|uniref:Uncharacterized protein n=1 Tax=Brucella daejeonensis TaxID=659015 RepID=A0A7W9AZX9_9HYPH|nr:hypothetical protein [Brucella daejeonensis]MBB5703567.1 hypothetical protein [Brucella daejeonensis]
MRKIWYQIINLLLALTSLLICTKLFGISQETSVLAVLLAWVLRVSAQIETLLEERKP